MEKGDEARRHVLAGVEVRREVREGREAEVEELDRVRGIGIGIGIFGENRSDVVEVDGSGAEEDLEVFGGEFLGEFEEGGDMAVGEPWEHEDSWWFCSH